MNVARTILIIAAGLFAGCASVEPAPEEPVPLASDETVPQSSAPEVLEEPGPLANGDAAPQSSAPGIPEEPDQSAIDDELRQSSAPEVLEDPDPLANGDAAPQSSALSIPEEPDQSAIDDELRQSSAPEVLEDTDQPGSDDAEPQLRPPEIPEALEQRLSQAIEVSEEQEQRIAQAQTDVYDIVYGTATKIDSFFGTAEGDTQASVTRGRLSIGGQYDEYNDFDGRVRFRAKVTLPAFEQRMNVFVGRGDADNAAAGVDAPNTTSLPSRFSDISDDEWLFGIGYSRDQKLRSGWSFDAGIKIRTPVEPYVRATYKLNQGFGDSWLFRMRPRVYWQEGRGEGWSVSTTLDWSPYDDWLYRLDTIALEDDRTQGTRWSAKLFTYNSLSPKSAFSYGLYARGEEDAEVPLQDYGIEVRHRRQISRRYLFVEFLAYLSWPQQFLIEEREITPGIGIEFELQFGEWPGRQSIRDRADEAKSEDVDDGTTR